MGFKSDQEAENCAQRSKLVQQTPSPGSTPKKGGVKVGLIKKVSQAKMQSKQWTEVVKTATCFQIRPEAASQEGIQA